MKKIVLLFSFFLSTSSYCQETPTPIGFKMKASTDDIKIYRTDNSGNPDLSHYKIIDNSVWYKQVAAEPVTLNNEKYVLIRIPSGDGSTNSQITPWSTTTDGNRISSLEFNIPLWIKESDFKKYAVPKYPGIKNQFTWGALTVPFRIRPSVNSHPSSIFNGDINIGAFVGYRAAFGEKFGISFVGSAGLSSLNQNASNNSVIKDTTSQSMPALTYGAGIILDWAKQFQLGLVLGKDNGFDKYSTTYIYQNKTWIALSLNFKFLKFESKKEETPKQN